MEVNVSIRFLKTDYKISNIISHNSNFVILNISDKFIFEGGIARLFKISESSKKIFLGKIILIYDRIHLTDNQG